MTPLSSPSPVPPPPHPSPAELPVRGLTLADLPACSDLAESRGWPREEHKWRLLLTAGRGYGVDAPHGDSPPMSPGQGGRPRRGLAGTVVLTPYGPSPGVPGAGAVCLGMVLVAERHSRRGLGRRLVRHALEESGDATVFLFATGTGRPLYEKLGFVPVASIDMLTGHFSCPCPGGADGHASDAEVTVRAATAADLPAVRALDAAAFGLDRSHLLVRLPSFADHFAVAVSGDRITGYAAAWPSGRTTVIGPVVAGDRATAQALTARLASRAAGPVRFDAYAHHRDLASWLRAHGLDGGFLCTLMVHGAPGTPMDLDRCFAPYSVALG